MGYNTTVVILNDHLSSIEEDEQFGKKLADAIRRSAIPKERPIDFGSGQVIESHHADGLTAIVVGGNTGRRLSYAGGYGAILFQGDDVFNILSMLANEHGFVLKKKAKG